jgi:hypothetical protein
VRTSSQGQKGQAQGTSATHPSNGLLWYMEASSLLRAEKIDGPGLKRVSCKGLYMRTTVHTRAA